MEPETLREWLMQYETTTAGATNKPATRGDVEALAKWVMIELKKLEDKTK